MSADELETTSVVVELSPSELAELRRRAAEEGLPADEDERLVRFAVYLGAGYLEAESAAGSASSSEEAFARLHRLLGAAQGEASVLRFRYSESARYFAEEQRAHAAHERQAGAYEALVEKMEEEIAAREQRVRNLEERLARCG